MKAGHTIKMFYTTPTRAPLPDMYIVLPSYTSSYSPTPTPTDQQGSGGDSDGNDGSGSVFSMNGSPPLIVAFLAIGLFTVSMSAIFAWRRMRQGRSRIAIGAGTAALRPMKKQVNLADKPMLNEVYTTTVEGLLLGDLRWEQVMPFAAILHHAPSPSLSPTLVNDGLITQETSPWSRFAHAIKDYIRPTRGLPPETYGPDPPGEKGFSTDALEELAADGSRVDIAVTIAMPSVLNGQRHDIHLRTPQFRNGSDGHINTGVMPDFCIGTLSVPLYEGG